MKYLLLVISTILISCGGDDVDVSEQVAFKFQLLGEDGQPATVFQEEENFIMSFSIINNSDEDVYFVHSSMDTENFFRIEKILDSQEENAVIDMGKPYDFIFCYLVNGYQIKSKDVLRLTIPWKPDETWQPGSDYYTSIFCTLNADNSLLSAGKYQTKFSSNFEFSISGTEFSLPVQYFQIDFTVE